MTDRLKKCPFCGGEGKLEINREMGGTQYYVLCTNCPTTVGRHWFWKKEDAINSWNTRKPMDRIIQELEAEAERWHESGKAFKDKKELGVASGFRYAIEIVKGEV